MNPTPAYLGPVFERRIECGDELLECGVDTSWLLEAAVKFEGNESV